jgi:MerR family mercuric resistance operon transcriptional regulator
MDKAFTRGQLARQATVNPATIRYYERKGLLANTKRSPAGYRIYSESTIRKVKLIKRVQALGFSLAEIAELFALQTTPERECAGICRQIREKIEDIEKKITHLKSIQSALSLMADNCNGKRTVRDCGVLEVLADD